MIRPFATAGHAGDDGGAAGRGPGQGVRGLHADPVRPAERRLLPPGQDADLDGPAAHAPHLGHPQHGVERGVRARGAPATTGLPGKVDVLLNLGQFAFGV